MTIALETRADGVVLPVQARPAARKIGILGVHGGAVRIGVTEVAEKGQANRALVEKLADALDLRRNQITLLNGATSRSKRFLVRGISQAELAQRLARALPSDIPS